MFYYSVAAATCSWTWITDWTKRVLRSSANVSYFEGRSSLSQGYCSFISIKLCDFAENDDCLHHAVHERLGELLRVLKTIISKHQSLNSVDILSTAGTVIATVKGELWSPMNTRMGNSQFSTLTYQLLLHLWSVFCLCLSYTPPPPPTVLSIGHPLFFHSYHVLSLSLSSQDILVTTNQGKFFL